MDFHHLLLAGLTGAPQIKKLCKVFGPLIQKHFSFAEVTAISEA
jgi:hypothetical protein